MSGWASVPLVEYPKVDWKTQSGKSLSPLPSPEYKTHALQFVTSKLNKKACFSKPGLFLNEQLRPRRGRQFKQLKQLPCREASSELMVSLLVGKMYGGQL